MPSADQENTSRTASAAPAVLHIEDDHLWAGVVTGLLSEWSEVCHVGTASNGHDGIVLCAKRKPDIVILDLGLPDLAGFAVLDRLKALACPPQILLLTCRMDQALLYRVGCEGIASLIWKNGDFAHHLRLALGFAATSRPYLPPEVIEAVRQFRTSPKAFFKLLSPWELELVSLLAQGLRDDEIAFKTGRRCGTIRNHWHNIAGKLGLTGRHDIRHWAESKGFGVASRPAIPPSSEN